MKSLQEKVHNFCKNNCLNNSVEVACLDLVSEIGEVCKEILKATNYGKNEFKKYKEFESELGDCFYSLICVANAADVDLEKMLELVLEKYKRRLKKGSAGSQSDS